MSAAPPAAPTGCPSTALPKAARVYRCGDCQRYHIPDAAYTRPSAADQERGLALYQEGVSLSAIARRFGVTPPAVSRWVKKGDARHCPGCVGGANSAQPTPPVGRRPR